MIKITFSVLSVLCAVGGLAMMVYSIGNGGSIADTLFSGLIPLFMSGILSQAN